MSGGHKVCQMTAISAFLQPACSLSLSPPFRRMPPVRSVQRAYGMAPSELCILNKLSYSLQVTAVAEKQVSGIILHFTLSKPGAQSQERLTSNHNEVVNRSQPSPASALAWQNIANAVFSRFRFPTLKTSMPTRLRYTLERERERGRVRGRAT